MPDTGAPWNIPYVAGTDLVSDWPTDSLALANAIASGLDAAGGLVSVHHTAKTNTQTVSATDGTWYDVTDLNVTLTPASATNAVIVMGTFTGSYGFGGLEASVAVRVLRDSTPVNIADAASNRTRGMSRSFIYGSGGNAMISVPFHFEDSPATTSSITYKVQMGYFVGGGGGVNIYCNRSNTDSDVATLLRGVSNLIVMEVAV